MAVLYGIGATIVLLGGYWAFRADKIAGGIFGVLVGSSALLFAFKLFRAAKAFKKESRQGEH